MTRFVSCLALAALATIVSSVQLTPPAPAVATLAEKSVESSPWSNKVKKGLALDTSNLPDIVVVIPSMRRWTKEAKPAPEKYLQPLVESIMLSMTPELQTHVSFMLLNVDKNPAEHKELLDLLSLPNVTLATRPPDNSAEMIQAIPRNEKGLFKDSQGREITETTLKWRAGETRDVSHLLLQAMPKAPYVLMLEDDVKATSNVMPKIFQFLDDMKKQGKDFFMVDMYTPAIWWGPQTALNMQPYDYECCTQAMLFKSSAIPELVAYELQYPQNPLDDNIRDFVRTNRDAHSVYAMIPNPFEHVGAYSSNPDKSTGVVEHRSLFFEP